MKTVEQIINSKFFTDEEFIYVAYNMLEDDRAFDWVYNNIKQYESFEETIGNGDDVYTGVIINGDKYYTHHWYDQNSHMANSISYYELTNGESYLESE